MSIGFPARHSARSPAKRPSDHDYASVIEQRLQDVDPAVFDDLAPGDVLFIDSSHVSKIDSAVNLLWGSQLRHHHPAKMHSLWPEWAADGGTSLWLETTDPGPAPR